MYDTEAENIDVLWRLGRACNNVASSFDQKDSRRKEKILEGHKYATRAYKLDETSFPVLKWCAVLVSDKRDFKIMYLF